MRLGYSWGSCDSVVNPVVPLHIINISTESAAAMISRTPGSKVTLYIVTLAWAALIFYFSTATFGPEFSQAVLAREIAIFHLKVSPTAFHHLDTLQRKAAHLTVYGVFALLLYTCMGTQDAVRWSLRQVTWCILIVAGYALTDEFHQIFVPGRNASLVNCGIDVAGATVALLALNQGQRLVRRTTGKTGPHKNA